MSQTNLTDMLINATLTEVDTVFTLEDEQILQQCTTQYGTDNQMQQLSEECLELALAIRKHTRAVESGDRNRIEAAYNDVVNEVADVIIMTAQSRVILGNEPINEKIRFKLIRQKKRLADKNYKH